MTEYWGVTIHFFLLTLYNFKNIGGARAPLPPYSTVPVRNSEGRPNGSQTEPPTDGFEHLPQVAQSRIVCVPEAEGRRRTFIVDTAEEIMEMFCFSANVRKCNIAFSVVECTTLF